MQVASLSKRDDLIDGLMVVAEQFLEFAVCELVGKFSIIFLDRWDELFVDDVKELSRWFVRCYDQSLLQFTIFAVNGWPQ